MLMLVMLPENFCPNRRSSKGPFVMSQRAWARPLMATTPRMLCSALCSRLLPSVQKVEVKPGDLHGTFSLGGCKQRAKYTEGFGFGELKEVWGWGRICSSYKAASPESFNRITTSPYSCTEGKHSLLEVTLLHPYSTSLHCEGSPSMRRAPTGSANMLPSRYR